MLTITVFHAGNITFAQSEEQNTSKADSTKKNRQLIIEKVSSTLMDIYIFKETAINMKKHIHQKFQDGEYNHIKSLKSRLDHFTYVSKLTQLSM